MRKIIHLDLDAFFCAVEEQRDPRLAGRPFAVGGKPEQRGVVASCSYPARFKGVRSAMPMSKAMRLCPGLIIVPHHFSLYHQASKRVMEMLHEVTPLVEQISVDEAFLDVTALPEYATRIGKHLQERIQSELGLPNSIGIATNKLVAKIATDVGKSKAVKGGPPNAMTVVLPGTEAAFLAPLPVRMLWGVGPKTEARLLEVFEVKTIGDLALVPELDLERIFGKNGAYLAVNARGMDDSLVVTSRPTRSVSQETTYSRDTADRDVLVASLREQAENISSDLQRKGLRAKTIRVKIRWADFSTHSRQMTTSVPTDDCAEIARLGIHLFDSAWQPGRLVRLLGLGASSLVKEPRQMLLFDLDKEAST